MDIEENLRLSLLFDLYKEMLTSKQKEMLACFLDKNLSLSELATCFKSSRQAVNDLIKRSIKVLNEYEEKLHLLEKFEKIKGRVEEIKLLLEKNKSKQSILNELDKLLEVM